MCKHCPSSGSIRRKCVVCRVWSGPAPPEVWGDYICARCAPNSEWNLAHKTSSNILKKIEPIPVILPSNFPEIIGEGE